LILKLRLGGFLFAAAVATALGISAALICPKKAGQKKKCSLTQRFRIGKKQQSENYKGKNISNCMVGSPGTTQWLYTQNTFPRVPL
jgi:hypothetical protein